MDHEIVEQQENSDLEPWSEHLRSLLTKEAFETSESTIEQPQLAGGNSEEPDPFQVLQRASETVELKGFTAAKPLFQQAIAFADQIDQRSVAEQLKKIEGRLNDPATDGELRGTLELVGIQLLRYKHAPVITRFQFAIAQNNSGDEAAAIATLQQVAKVDPELARDPVFKAVLELVQRKEQITPEKLQHVSEKEHGGAGGGNPYQHLEAAREHEKKGNAMSAEESLKKAIDAADKLPFEEYRAKLAETEAALKVESDPIKSQLLLKLMQGVQEVISLPVTLRMEGARFYLMNEKPDEAKVMLEEALQKDPTIKEREDFRRLAQVSVEWSKGSVEKALSFMESSMKELGSDIISGTGALAIASLTPGGRLLKVGVGLMAGGAIKHQLSVAGMGGDPNDPVKNFLWGAIDFAALSTGASVHGRLTASLEQRLSTQALKDMAIKSGITETERLAMLEGKSGLNGLRVMTELLGEQVAAKQVVRGSRLHFFDFTKMFRSVESSSLRDLQASTFWHRFRIDAATAGASSLYYRGAHEFNRIGMPDATTGKVYSLYDAVQNTLNGAAGDALSAGFLVGGVRDLQRVFGSFAARLGISRPLIPVLDGALSTTASSIRIGASAFSPQLLEIYATQEQYAQYEDILKEMQKPLEDKPQPQELPTEASEEKAHKTP